MNSQNLLGRIGFGGFALIAILVAVAASSTQLFETNYAGFVKIRQMPVTGTMNVVMKPGMFGQWFGRVTEYKQAGTYTFTDQPVADAEDSAMSEAVEVRFNDGGIARLSGNARFDLPMSHEAMINIHSKFRTYAHIAETLVKPAIAEALILTASLMSAEESYSGRRAEFAQLAWDQVLNGIYLTEWTEAETINELTGEKKKSRIVNIKYDEAGEPVRKPNPLKAFDIRISQFFLDKDFGYEQGVLKQISNQRDARMKTVSAKAEAEKALQDKITAEAQGQANVMTARYEAEVVKEKSVVDAERAKEVAETEAQKRLEVALLDRKAAEQYKMEQILRAEGDSTYKRKVMAADGALKDKLSAMVEIQRVWAQAYSKRQVPAMVMGGGGQTNGPGGTDTGSVDFSQMLTLIAARQLGLDLSVPKGGKP